MQPFIFSFFSGAGFLDLGFEKAGFKIVHASDISSDFIHAYKFSRRNLKLPLPEYGCHSGEAGDIKEFIDGNSKTYFEDIITEARRATDIIGFIGGPPCPDFSIGGKNRGREGNLGKLSTSYIEIICQYKPDFFLFENVKGLWKTKKHRFFYEELKRKAIKSGYILTENLINSIEYGVPQDRERIILIGFNNRVLRDNNLLNHSDSVEKLFPWDKYTSYSKDVLLNYNWPSRNTFGENSILPCPDNISLELTVEFWFSCKNQVKEHFNASHHFKPRSGKAKFMSIEEGDNSRKSFKRLHRWRYSPTACYGNNEVHLHPYKPRRISVAEALAIQSMPRNFIFPDNLSLTSMFKAIGNGVPYLAAQGIAKSIFDFLLKPQSYDKIQSKKLDIQLVLPLEL
ncbi:DNA cytosine methyltransferase [Oxynema aestuarii]|uniref:DNA (cytosine-5-)-methyltransferase n=1 Tax=Oxynema aestuarii AP17 TaxID=2064643 RepID=A0A6H1U386_9CYAN|nr:DNA cytosine methyltransferase [Oxynema aestuarii]QIZ73332.1 DNA cytosine methyltransferase [Oxynema aestuarii AP17]